MKLNQYNILLIWLCSIIFFAKNATAQTVNLQMIGNLDCENNRYCSTIQIQAADENSFKIGTSSIFFNYNENALAFNNYNSLRFNGSDLCAAGMMSIWAEHAIDGTSLPNEFMVTLMLLADGNGCPTIDNTQWIDIGEVCFDMVDNAQNPQIVFSELNTNFNSDSPNDGSQAIAKGTFLGIDSADILAQTSENCGESCTTQCLEISVTPINN